METEKQIERQELHLGQYLECPKHKGNAMRPAEVCYFKCKWYNKCPAVKLAYTD